MPDDSRAIPLLKVDDKEVIEKPREADSASAKLYKDVLPGVVAIEAGNVGGSGFALGDARHFVTNYHVVAEQTEAFVRTQDGLKYRAKVVKMDDIKDLAVLEIVGDTPKVKPLTLGDENKLAPNSKINVLGHPECVPTTMLSVGTFKGLTTNERRLRPEVREDFDSLRLDAGDKASWLQNKLLDGNVQVRPGNSGGPALDEKGSVVGVTVYKGKDGESKGFMVPASDLKALIDSTKNKYEFNYQYQLAPGGFGERFNELMKTKPLGTIAVSAGAVGAEVWALRRATGLGRNVGLGTAIYGGSGLLEDVPNFLDATSNRDRLKAGMATLGDTSLLAGGALRYSFGNGAREVLRPALSTSMLAGVEGKLATSFGAEVLGATRGTLANGMLSASERAVASGAGNMMERYLTKTGRIGIGLIAVGAAIKLGSEFVPTNLVNTSIIRTDGKPQREPFYLGSKSATP